MIYEGMQMRCENKIIIPYTQYLLIKNRISAIMPMDKHSVDGGYHVRSLYFDDIFNTALNDNMAGIRVRKKFRIRIYNLDENYINLEKKAKIENLIGKKYQRINKDTYYELLNGNDILFTDNKSVMAQLQSEKKSKLLSPKVVVDYHREAYICNASNVRITFDLNVCAGKNLDIFEEDMPLYNVFDKNEVILEIKYNNFLPDYIRKIVQPNGYSLSAASKYTLCRKVQRRLINNVSSCNRLIQQHFYA